MSDRAAVSVARDNAPGVVLSLGRGYAVLVDQANAHRAAGNLLEAAQTRKAAHDLLVLAAAFTKAHEPSR